MPSATLTSSRLTPCQEKAFEMLQREGNIFLTGAAGTGKSYLLEQYLARKPTEEFPIVASTGAAAVIVGGRTFHSFFGLGILEGGIEATVQRAMRSRRLILRLQRACCVIIDEISMLSGTTLLAADRIARRARHCDQPWGGLRIIVVGDFAQLPPVTPGSEQKDWAFLHGVWQESAFQPALLSTVMRTQDTDFLDVLNFIRGGIVNDQVRQFLNDHTADALEQADAPRLYPHRSKADAYNELQLATIPGSPRAFPTKYEGDERAMLSGKRSLPIPEVLTLKVGALVMLRKNDPSEERRYVNGSLGYVQAITEDSLHIRLHSGDGIEVERTTFTCLDGDGNVVLAAYNFPVTLAWATTIHKAQGATMDCMMVDLASLWEPGQAYVALSRVRSGAGVFVERWSASSIRAEPLVTELYDTLAAEMKTYVPRPLYQPVIVAPEQKEKKKREAPTHGVKQWRAGKIRELITRQVSFEEMVAACGLKPDRVLLYIEEFLEQGKALSLGHLIEGLPDVDTMRSAFEEHGTLRLRPVFDALQERIPYTTLRLVRCVVVAERGE
ncbi:MAG: RRM3/PIF1 helicase-like protein [Candidatus Peregrinibacteria bacterium Greene0416_62]|nr:MAG: RRM3/PIF1 helicase-like protein [Candidatus Peregrinibacteria bacterium Greene0416_62]TSC98768.1 MAG: RRM3/PIF1 helicase-like protein [Candidatus Peregrinibacteria bacterium Greene1014_49]